MTDQLATTTVEQTAITAPAPTMTRALAMRATMEAETEVRALLAEYVERNMLDGTDYGKIPGTPKPTLLKPGAEKLVDLFHCEPQYEVTHRVERWEDAAPLFHYEFRCKIVERASGKVLAEGFGSANSKEGRYRWRNGERTCPECGAAAIIKGKVEYGGGFVCFKKKGGCGAKFDDGQPVIVDQQIGKVENDDVFTLVNTILKMAKKRALVDGAIALARCSDLFTQDVEDIGGQFSSPSAGDDPRESRTGGPPADEWGDSRSKPRERSAGHTARRGRQAPLKAEPANSHGTNREYGMESAPSFGGKLEWEGREQWRGKPLASADLETLLRYEAALQKALERPELNQRQADALDHHMRDVQMAIAIKEPPDSDPSNGYETADAPDPGAP